MEFAWDELTVEEATDLAGFVTLYRSFEFDLPAARSFGSTLVAHVAATMQAWEAAAASPYSPDAYVDAAFTEPDENPCPNARPKAKHTPDKNVVYYAAHDTNLLYVAEILGLKWLSKGGCVLSLLAARQKKYLLSNNEFPRKKCRLKMTIPDNCVGFYG